MATAAKIRPIRARSTGLRFEDAMKLFLRSRQRGTEGAKRPCREKTVANYQQHLNHFFEFMCNRGLTHYGQIDKYAVDDFVDFVLKYKKWSNATRMMKWLTLRIFFKWTEANEECQEEGMRSFKSRIPSVGKMPQRNNAPTSQDVQKFIESINTQTRAGARDRVIAWLLLDCGLRAGEISALAVDDIDLDNGYLSVPSEDTKTGFRRVPVTEDMVRMFERWLRLRQEFAECDKLFVTDEGNLLKAEEISRSFVRRGRKAGIAQSMSPHMWRHYYATTYLAEGGDLATLQEITGHKNIEMLRRYIHLAGGKVVKRIHEKVSPLKKFSEAKRSKKS